MIIYSQSKVIQFCLNSLELIGEFIQKIVDKRELIFEFLGRDIIGQINILDCSKLGLDSVPDSRNHHRHLVTGE